MAPLHMEMCELSCLPDTQLTLVKPKRENHNSLSSSQSQEASTTWQLLVYNNSEIKPGQLPRLFLDYGPGLFLGGGLLIHCSKLL